MGLLVAFIIFAVSMIGCLLIGISTSIALLMGLFCFTILALYRKFSLKDLICMIWTGAKKSFVVLRILLLIGLITALWRSSGTIAFFVYHGISMITPHMFVLIAFLLTAVLSFALGTSFGLAGTVGVILMALARGGGVDVAVTAGAIMSGAYFGDRCAPASSSANLVAAVTDTELYRNVRQMLKTGIIPMVITIGVYAVLSYLNPIESINMTMLITLKQAFSLSWWIVLPAAVMLILPLFKIEVGKAMAGSIVAAFIMTIFVQGETLGNVLKLCVFGYVPHDDILFNILGGGGLISMIEVMLIVLISSTYSGIFDGTGMLDSVQNKITAMAEKAGLFPTMILTSVLTAGIFCNQTIATMLNSQLLGNVYHQKGASSEELAIDIENSVITLSGIIPWNIACVVPLGMLGAGPEAVPYSVLLYMIPICYLFTKRIWYKQG